ncbi:MAG: hypothetical protein LBT32_08805 [Peptococcaceae bacterium]|nr:hypothetical protein [Peptococcaceae bacterium]
MNIKLNVGIQIYNTCLGQALKCLRAVRADKNYRTAVETKQYISRILEKISGKKSECSDKQREQYDILKSQKDELLKYIRWLEQFYGYSEFDMFKFVSNVQCKFKSNIGSLEAQELAARAFRAVEKLHYHEADKIRFKHYGDETSVANKNNNSGLRYVNGMISWGGKLNLRFTVRRNDVYAQTALCDTNKYVRIIRRDVRGKQRFFVEMFVVSNDSSYSLYKKDTLLGKTYSISKQER